MTNRILILTLILLLNQSTMAQITNQTANNSKITRQGDETIIEFDYTTFDFGNILENSPYTAIFPFTNTGKTPLIINAVKVSCGCMSPFYHRKREVLPEARDTIKISFNAIGRIGSFHKSATVYINTGNEAVKLLFIEGRVIYDKLDIQFLTNDVESTIQVIKGEEIDTLVADFGKISLGEIKSKQLKFKNIGKNYLFLDYAGSPQARIFSHKKSADSLYKKLKITQKGIIQTSTDPYFSYHANRILRDNIGYFNIFLQNISGIGYYTLKSPISFNNNSLKYYLIIKGEFIDDGEEKIIEIKNKSSSYLKKYFREGKFLSVNEWSELQQRHNGSIYETFIETE